MSNSYKLNRTCPKCGCKVSDQKISLAIATNIEIGQVQTIQCMAGQYRAA